MLRRALDKDVENLGLSDQGERELLCHKLCETKIFNVLPSRQPAPNWRHCQAFVAASGRTSPCRQYLNLGVGENFQMTGRPWLRCVVGCSGAWRSVSPGRRPPALGILISSSRWPIRGSTGSQGAGHPLSAAGGQSAELDAALQGAQEPRSPGAQEPDCGALHVPATLPDKTAARAGTSWRNSRL